jgi:hypothetical protein
MREIFEKLARRKDWSDPLSPNRPKKFTVHRQRQLADIFKLHGGNKIQFKHFTSELVKNPVKRNRLAFPAVFGYLFGILKIDGDGLVKPKKFSSWRKTLAPKCGVMAVRREYVLRNKIS